MKTRKLYIGNISRNVTCDDLEELFSQYGEVDEVTIKKGDGYGFVEMSRRSEAERAKQALDGLHFKGNDLRVDEARPAKKKRMDPRLRKSHGRRDSHKTVHLEDW